MFRDGFRLTKYMSNPYARLYGYKELHLHMNWGGERVNDKSISTACIYISHPNIPAPKRAKTNLKLPVGGVAYGTPK